MEPSSWQDPSQTLKDATQLAPKTENPQVPFLLLATIVKLDVNKSKEKRKLRAPFISLICLNVGISNIIHNGVPNYMAKVFKTDLPSSKTS